MVASKVFLLLAVLTVGSFTQLHAAMALPLFGNKTLATAVVAAKNATLHALVDVKNAEIKAAETALFKGVDAEGAAAAELAKLKATAASRAAVAAAAAKAGGVDPKADLVAEVDATQALKTGAAGPAVVPLPVSLQSLSAGGAPAGDIMCYEDPTTGVVVGWEQGGVVTCATSNIATMIPLSSGYISGIKVALDKKTGGIGRMVFEVTPNKPTGFFTKASYFYCGSAGTLYSHELLPSNSALAGLAGTCGAGGGSGRRLLAPGPNQIDAESTMVVVAPLDPGAGPPPAGPRLVRPLDEAVKFAADLGASVPTRIVAYAVKVAAERGTSPPPPGVDPGPPGPPPAWRFGNTRLDSYGVAWGNSGLTLLALLSADPATIAVSRDGGATFSSYHSSFTDWVAINRAWTGALASSVDGRTMYAGTSNWLNATGGVDRLEDIFYNGDLIKSSDGGLSFQRMNIYPPGEGPVLSVDNVQTNGDGSAVVATATVSSGYYVDNDEGTVLQGLRTSWLWSTGDSPDLIVTYTSVDGGATWVPSTIGGFSPSNRPNDILRLSKVLTPVQMSNDGSHIYSLISVFRTTYDANDNTRANGTVEVGSELQYSSDLGASWTLAFDDPYYDWIDYAVGGPSGELVAAIFVTADDNMPSYWSIYLSTDRGVNFEELDFTEVSDATELTNVVVSADGKLLAVSTNTGIIAATLAANGTWVWQNVGAPEDDWILAGIESGTGSSRGNLFAFDTNDSLWTPFGPGKTLADPSTATSAAYAVGRKAPALVASYAAAPPEPSSVVTSTKIIAAYVPVLAQELQQAQWEALGISVASAPDGVNMTGVSASPEFSVPGYVGSLVADQIIVAGCTSINVCNGVQGAMQQAMNNLVPRQVCSNEVVGFAANMALGFGLDKFIGVFGAAFGQFGAILPSACPNVPGPFDILITAAGYVVEGAQIAIDLAGKAIAQITQSAFPTLKPYKPVWPPGVARIPFGKPCNYPQGDPRKSGWIYAGQEYVTRGNYGGRTGSVELRAKYIPGCDNVRDPCCEAYVDGSCFGKSKCNSPPGTGVAPNPPQVPPKYPPFPPPPPPPLSCSNQDPTNFCRTKACTKSQLSGSCANRGGCTINDCTAGRKCKCVSTSFYCGRSMLSQARCTNA